MADKDPEEIIQSISSNAEEASSAMQTVGSPFQYACTAPSDCPWPKSKTFRALEFTGRYRNYTNADTWYPSWAEDDCLYSPWTDGYVLDSQVYSAFDATHPGTRCHSLDFGGFNAATGQARISGPDPMNLVVEPILPNVEGSPAPYGGRYPCANLVKDGIWYYGTYCLTNHPTSDCGGVGWTEFGPFVGFRTSRDYGRTWANGPRTPTNPLFGEDPKKAKIKMGSPHFVDFGKNMTHSPDGLAYLVAHGSTDPASWNNYIQGDHIYLARVKPSIKTINDLDCYEFYAGKTGGKPVWSKRMDAMKPLLSWPCHLGCVTITFNPALNNYLMFVTRGTSGHLGDTMFLESDRLTGPWKLVQYLKNFGPNAYFINIPTKFISADGLTFWLCYSANWIIKNRPGNPPGSHYSLSLHEVTLLA
ncbi:MAG: hypothetical protein AB3N33_09320 [Puniceicoccaceae bacterium]